MILVAAELDASSERIINYLADHHDISINAVFFDFFASDGNPKHILPRPVNDLTRDHVPRYVSVCEGI